MNARNAFANEKTPEQNRNFNLGARGPIVKGKTSIRLGLDGRRDYQADTIVAIDANGNRLGDYVRRRPSPPTPQSAWSTRYNNQTLRLGGIGMERMQPRTPASVDSTSRTRSTSRAATTRSARRHRGSSARTCCTRSGCR